MSERRGGGGRRLARLLGRLIVLAIAAAVLFVAYDEVEQRLVRRNSEPPVTVPIAVQTEQLSLSRVTPELTFGGSLVALQGTWISPLTSGQIVAVLQADGAMVKKGDVLVRLDSRAAAADLDAALAQVAVDRAKAKRDSILQEEGLVSKEVLETTKAQLVASQSQVVAKRLNVELLQVRAPFAGMLGRHLASAGAYVSPGDKLVRLTGLDQFAIDFQVPQQLLGQIAQGTDVGFDTDALPGSTFTGKVSFIDPNVDTGTRSFLARALIDNPDRMLRPGLFGRLHLRVGSPEQRLTVPVAAVVPAITGSYVFRVTQGHAEHVDVATGQQYDDRVVVTKGLAVGDHVVTAGLFRLRDGDPVEIIAGEANAPSHAPRAPRAASR